MHCQGSVMGFVGGGGNIAVATAVPPSFVYSMTDRLLGNAFGVLSCQFWSTVLQRGARLPIKLLYHAVSGARFLTGDVFECDIAYLRLLQYCVCCVRSGITEPSYWCSTWTICASAGYTWCPGRTTEYFPVSKCDLAVPQDFCSLFSVSLERSC